MVYETAAAGECDGGVAIGKITKRKWPNYKKITFVTAYGIPTVQNVRISHES